MSVQEVNFFAGEQNLYGGYQYEGLNLRGSISTRGSIRGGGGSVRVASVRG